MLSNMMVDLGAVVDIDPEEVGVTRQCTIRYLLDYWKKQLGTLTNKRRDP